MKHFLTPFVLPANFSPPESAGGTPGAGGGGSDADAGTPPPASLAAAAGLTQASSLKARKTRPRVTRRRGKLLLILPPLMAVKSLQQIRQIRPPSSISQRRCRKVFVGPMIRRPSTS